ncbi:glutamate--cysteine ligase [Planctomicrobium sp. SH661]|uniref:glutamate--cysteine ligase n=1 Tax=Planctomicrobium sp. SH661 TaxID=3448124 RepID=UPI003F5B2053
MPDLNEFGQFNGHQGGLVMGREISASHFQHADFHRFERRMVTEMALLHEYFRTGRFSSAPPCIGLELEMWLTNLLGEPQPRNSEFLDRVGLPDVVPELSQFNVEFNVPHQPLTSVGLSALERDLGETWKAAELVARQMEMSLVAIGVLPTIESKDLSLATMSEMSRFRALNEQVRRLRRGRPIRIHIPGEELLSLEHDDVMLEAAATSLQVHYQVPLAQAVRYYNAAVIASGPVLGVSANSPFLFGKHCWAESRIPLFESSVELGGPFPRVHFGSGYAMDSLEEFFLENRSCHPVLLPIEVDEPVEMLPHLRLHNGTIWRWNRPLVGFDENGQPHLRIEHRVMPAGPTLIDMLANIAFATGLIHWLATHPSAPESTFPFEKAEQNFQQAARSGINAEQTWINGETLSLPELIWEHLLPAARTGLQSLNIDFRDIGRYLEIIEKRVQCGQNGAVWQVKFAEKYGRNLPALTRTYSALQKEGRPVHEWEV